jgi:DNA-binding NarL/FixJ family response regulator
MQKPQQLGRSVTVVIADPSRLKSQLIAESLQRSSHQIVVAGSAGDSTSVYKRVRETNVDVAVISSELTDGPIVGFEVSRQLRASHSSIKVIMVLDSSAPTLIVEAFRAGADGVLSRDDPFEILCKCIHAVHCGQVWANSAQLHFVIDALGKSAPSQINSVLGAKVLTQREEGLVHLVSQGFTNREISKQLNLSEHTVRNYLFRIFNKLGTSNRLELALYSIHRNGGPDPSLRSDVGSDAELVTPGAVQSVGRRAYDPTNGGAKRVRVSSLE